MIGVKIDLPAEYKRPNGNIDTSRIKANISIAQIASTVADLRRSGSQLKGLCPFHEEANPSFFVDEIKGVYHCHGCGAGGDAIELYTRINNCSFVQACAELVGSGVHYGDGIKPTAKSKVDRAVAVERAQRIWRGACDIGGTVAETYLVSRHIAFHVPATVRFSPVPRYWREDGQPGPLQPAMIAAAQDVSGRVAGIQRTFLTPEGRKTSKGDPRLSLGRIRGSALRLGPCRPEIMLACAVEDALALRLMFPGATVWAAFGDANLPDVQLPSEVRRVTLCGDADNSGRAAVAAARDVFEAKGLTVSDLFPKAACKDFNEEWVLLHA